LTLPPGGGRSIAGMSPRTDEELARGASGGCCGGTGLFGWSPPDLPADTPLKRGVDRYLPRTGVVAVLYFAAVAALVAVAQLLPARAELLVLSVAGLAAGGWCALNFWRCRHAHCLITGTGWLAFGGLTAAEAALGHSLVGGAERAVFGGVLAAGLVFECGWSAVRGTNALRRASSYPVTRNAAVRSSTDGAPQTPSGPR